jgi:cyclomaltodextrinase
MFHSRNPVFRDPVGAVAAGTAVHFKITLPRSLSCSAARLVVTEDFSGARKSFGMFWCGMNGGDAEFWECHYTPEQPGLYFYFFQADTCKGTLDLTRGPGGEGDFNPGGPEWQLTAYDGNFTTPEWLPGGVMYQIFPDRFFCSGQKKENIPADRKIHETWGEQPDWMPDENGKITNGDYFGGDLRGIEEKLDYLKSLGVTCLYLNPIFEAHSNHRYDTADYCKIDSLLGTEEDFRSLCRKAAEVGIRIILDGVFNHTGSDSVYFNREGRYPQPGAYQSQNSPYYSWYRFRNWPESYESWWGFPTLPDVDDTNPDFNRFICGENGVIRKWLRAGASGWRLDVADELSDGFLEDIRTAARAEKSDALILGEVWEDASNKIAYGKRRHYLEGRQLDSVMNYPFRSAILGYLTGSSTADMMEQILTVLENYPPQVIRCLMNIIGTHDTERALTVLAGEPLCGRGRDWQSRQKLTPRQRQYGLALMRLASLMQFTLPGVPCIYYGDEVGVEGYRDPFNRSCYPWQEQDKDLLGWYRFLGKMRAECSCLRDGAFVPVKAEGDTLAYLRKGKEQTLLCALNRSERPQQLKLSGAWCKAKVLAGPAPDKTGTLTVPSVGYGVLLLPGSDEYSTILPE